MSARNPAAPQQKAVSGVNIAHLCKPHQFGRQLGRICGSIANIVFFIRNLNTHEKNRLYDLLQEQTARGIDLLDDIFGQYEDSAEPKERRKLLAKAAVVGAYIKRRGNLMFIGEKSNVTDTAELGLCLNESFANIELFGAECALSVPVRVRIRTEDAISTYDFFEEIIEAAMDDLRSVWLKAHIVEERVVFCIEVETSADLSGNTKVYSGGKTEEDVWRFTFAVGKEGAKE